MATNAVQQAAGENQTHGAHVHYDGNALRWRRISPKSRLFLAASATGIAAALTASPAHAQLMAATQNAPVVQSPDGNGVDIQSGRLGIGLGAISIGSGEGALSYHVQTSDHVPNMVIGYVRKDTSVDPSLGVEYWNVRLLGRSDRFKVVAVGVFQNSPASGATLVKIDPETYVYTAADGTTATFKEKPVSGGPAGVVYYPTVATLPSGLKYTWNYEIAFGAYRRISLSNSLGYQLRFKYQTSGNYESITAFNMANENCAPNAPSCTLASTWPKLTFALSVSTNGQGQTIHSGTYTDTLGNATNWTDNVTTTVATLTSDEGRQTVYDYSNVTKYQATYGAVDTVARAGQTWTYQRTHPSYNVNEGKIFTPGGYVDRHVVWLDTSGTINNEYLGHYARSLSYTRNADLTVSGQSITASGETSTSQQLYDTGKNPTFSKLKSTVSGEPDLVTEQGGYAASCTNPKTCHKPAWSKDARGNQTDYTYDPTHGGLLTVTAPADQNGIRPKTTYTYGQRQALYYNGSTLVSGDPVWVVTRISTCRTTANCVNTTDELRTDFTYETANALRIKQIDIKDGTNTVLRTITRTFNPTGDLETEDGPRAGTGDTTRYYYDLMRRLTGIIGPDPDDAGAANRTASRITYDGDGNVVLREDGTATSQSATGMTTFTPLQAVEYVYNARGELAQERLKSGSTVHSVTQYTSEYTSTGSYTCVAQRMNPSTFASLPPSACTLATAGSHGPDRITRTDYDQLGRPLTVTVALGTADQAVEQTYTYSALRTSTLADAEGNKTTMLADGYLRPSKTTYPSTTKGSGTSNPSDYEQLGYDANGNVTSFMTRRGETLAMNYDNLNRLIRKTVPERSGLSRTHTRDVFFSYDLWGGMTSACFGNTTSTPETVTGECITNTHDVLGQVTRATSNMDSVPRHLDYAYNTAGSRIQMTYPDGNYVYNVLHDAGGLNVAYLNGSSPLYYRPYDSQGRVDAVFRWNTAAANWDSFTDPAYDPVSRLSYLGHNLAGTTYDTSTTFGYNPASQIVSSTRTNDLYAWNGQAAVNRPYDANGLNEYNSVAGIAFAHDANGNLTSDGVDTYVYDVENRMVGRTSAGTTFRFRYDPLGRFYEHGTVSSVGVYTPARRYYYDGDDLVLEYNIDGTLAHRYVHGPGAGDDPLVWFSGSTVADSARKYLYADERGSIVAVTDSSGNVTSTLKYDEYGIPAAGNASRFQYTGQAWHPAFGMYYYKARLYSPTLGRFMQTDPIGYGDGMNMYAYVGNDPMNKVDPTGLCGNPGEAECPPIIVTGQRPDPGPSNASTTGFGNEPLPGQTGFDPAPALPRTTAVRPQQKKSKPKYKICKGRALVYAGNPRHVGRTGGMLRPIRPGAAAIIPRQWTGERAAGPVMRDNGALVGGVTGGGQRFSGLDDTAGNTALGPDPQGVLLARADGALYIELVTGRHEGATNVTLAIPFDSPLGCPEGTTQTGTR